MPLRNTPATFEWEEGEEPNGFLPGGGGACVTKVVVGGICVVVTHGGGCIVESGESVVLGFSLRLLKHICYINQKTFRRHMSFSAVTAMKMAFLGARLSSFVSAVPECSNLFFPRQCWRKYVLRLEYIGRWIDHGEVGTFGLSNVPS